MGRPRKKKNPDLLLTLDFGGSGLKCIYQMWGNEPKVLFMEPEVIEANPHELIKVKTQHIFQNVYPENMAWIGIEGDYQAIGYFASAKFNAINRLKPKKHSLAIYRTLAAIWVIQQKLNLPSQIEIALSVLLPPGELSDAEMMLNQLKKSLNSFETPTGQLNVTSANLTCYPEGIGVYFLYQNNSEIVNNKVVAFIMVGYRNASILLSKRGVITDVRSTDLGMIRYLETVTKKTSGLKPEQIIEAIAKAEEEKSKQGKSELQGIDFLSLTEWHLSLDLRKKQAQQILDAVNNSKIEYVKRIQQWLSEVLPSIQEVVFCGGTVNFFQKELDNLFPATPVKWHSNFIYPEELNEKWLGNRLADAYGLFKYFEAEMNQKYHQKKLTKI